MFSFSFNSFLIINKIRVFQGIPFRAHLGKEKSASRPPIHPSTGGHFEGWRWWTHVLAWSLLLRGIQLNATTAIHLTSRQHILR